MNTIDAIKQRRSVKHYDADHKMSQEEKDQIIELGMLSPTAFNIQNVRYVIVEDQNLREEIKKASFNQEQVTSASMLIVLCADLKSWQKDPQRYWVNAPKEVQDQLVPMISSYYEGKEQIQRDEAMRSCGLAAQTLMLAAKAMGYDSCPMDGFDFEEVAKIIKLPEDHTISMFVVIGKAIKEVWPRPGQLPIDEVRINNTF